MRWLAALALASSVACSESSLPTQPTPGPVPPPPFTFAGVISESETNTPLAGASVCWGAYPEISCGLTGADGSYQFTADPSVRPNGPGLSLCPFAYRDGFETRGACRPVSGSRVSWETTLQRKITVEAGRSVVSTLFRGEGSGPIDELCEPCKTLHVSVPGSGTLVVRLMAEAAESGLQLVVPYAAFRPGDGSLPVTTERDIVVNVKGAAVLPAKFELSTMFTPGS